MKDELHGLRKKDEMEKLISLLYDSMTECVYAKPITSFSVDVQPQEVFEVDILGKGRAALERANDELGELRVLSNAVIYCFIVIIRIFSHYL